MFINFEHKMIKSGNKNITVIKLHIIPFDKIIPISAPIFSCIKTRASKPAIVVRELAQISGIDLVTVFLTARICFSLSYNDS